MNRVHWQRAPPRLRGPEGMLYADKRALETNLKVSLLAIREKELNYYVRARHVPIA